jgi:hypothetical protein
VAALARAAGWSEGTRLAWLAQVAAPNLAYRTHALSATLLRLAARGKVIEPFHHLLSPGRCGMPRWLQSLHDLVRVGGTTGRAYALGLGVAMTVLTQGSHCPSAVS